ncbi:hypothetical protein GCM10009530_00270 [Microbispora corallina]|uniref:Uncharacterized protein n=1 Tax=Microbispora corallina TaxID=83302 RepID=A0ABQ4FSE8_9ACTN|nr:hypothetical protein [Microbispora corallina]GIH37745.1 hypothetical protein Mco01_07450 [Microbispora corallina]
MNPIIRGTILVAAAALPRPGQRERYREQWLADAVGAAELGMSGLSVALGALRAAVAMNLTAGAAPALGLAVVLVIGGIRLALTREDWIPGAATALAGVALPFLLMIIRRFGRPYGLGDWRDLFDLRRSALSRRGPSSGGRRAWIASLVFGSLVLVTVSATLLLHTWGI